MQRSGKEYLGALLVLGVVQWITTPVLPASERRPHILLILADDMGYGDPQCYNPDSRCPTPHIDRLAQQGMRFTDAHAGGAWCTPSRYSLLTGRYAFRTSLAWQKQPVIAAEVQTLAGTLAAAGYQTAMVGKWHLGFEQADRLKFDAPLRGGPCDRGFAEFFGLPASLDIPDFYWIHDRQVTHPPTVALADGQSPLSQWNAIQGKFWRGGKRGEDFNLEECLDRLATESTQRIERFARGDRPFFLYVPLTSPHTPWLPSERYRYASGAGLYSQFVAHTDAVVGRLLDALSTAGIEEQTLVVFTSDNGPVWYAYDQQRFGHDAMGGWRGMKGDVWEAGHRIPFVVRWPGRVPAGAQNDQLLGFVDVHATLAELGGGTLPASAVDSQSFAATWLGEQHTPVRRELVCFQQAIALRSGDWKLVTRPGSSGFLAHDRHGHPFLAADELNPTAGNRKPAEGQLYNLRHDPGERKNLWRQRPDMVRALTKQLEKLAPRTAATD